MKAEILANNIKLTPENLREGMAMQRLYCATNAGTCLEVPKMYLDLKSTPDAIPTLTIGPLR